MSKPLGWGAVSLRSLVQPGKADDMRMCPRCGIEWRDAAGRWQDRAPCMDCRPYFFPGEVDRYRSGRKATSQAGIKKPQSEEQRIRKNARAREKRARRAS